VLIILRFIDSLLKIEILLKTSAIFNPMQWRSPPKLEVREGELVALPLRV
jgi:hypothetical protein